MWIAVCGVFLRAGYDQVVMCSQGKRHLQKIRVLAADRLSEPDLGRVLFLEPEGLPCVLILARI
jgi:hypothetical protein